MESMMGELITTPNSELRQRFGSVAAEAANSCGVLAELVWTALPEALDGAITEALGADGELAAPRAWVNAADRQGQFGLTVVRGEGGEAPLRLTAWVVVDSGDVGDGEDGSGERLVLFDYAAWDCSKRNGVASAGSDLARGLLDCEVGRYALLNGRPDRFSLDITDGAGEGLCRLSYLLQADGEAVWWASSNFPERLGLAGGRYELMDVQVHGLTEATKI